MPKGVYERENCGLNGFDSKTAFYKKYKLIMQKKYKSPMRVITINLPYPVIKQLDDFKGVLYPSRSEATRRYIMQGVQRDLEFLRLLNGDFEVNEEMFPETDHLFTDEWGITWYIGRAIDRV